MLLIGVSGRLSGETPDHEQDDGSEKDQELSDVAEAGHRRSAAEHSDFPDYDIDGEDREESPSAEKRVSSDHLVAHPCL